METKIKPLPNIQAQVLKTVFEETFREDALYLDLVEMDEVFSCLIGGDVEVGFWELLERSVTLDDENCAFMVFLSEYIEILRKEAEDIEYYEMCNNLKEFKTIIDGYIYTPDSGDLS